MILLTAFALADFCADRGEAFQAPEIAAMKDKIASSLNEIGVPKATRDTAWQAAQKGLTASGMDNLSGPDLARECSKHRQAVATLVPGTLSKDVGKKNPF
ncbi:hypothetical protein [Bradyrhizobium sp. NAS80.1]|uniref:hypothetical protein n=1 Tax=Bradyrhizobium sp. NAS80.1 TaxID=1680159 RepID=UPI001160E767|nr:hypothetical protein [Bradyrhizobium sp. NAS80.1]